MKNKESSNLERIEIELLLNGIYQYYGLDFRNYAYSSIRRRILYRMHTENLTSISQLQDQVLHHPTMMDKLYNDFSINVTEMFRDPSFFNELRVKVIPELRRLQRIRIWHAGCSTGEEVYSMAILLKEEGLYDKTRIYATDLNEKVLEIAKQGKIPLQKMKDYTANYIQAGGSDVFSQYYTVKNSFAYFHQELFKNITFAQHNLVTDGSFNEFHLILCRNVLIYFNRELQERVHFLFYHSLSNKGFLGLGNREGLLKTFPYQIISEKEKIYQKNKESEKVEKSSSKYFDG